MFPPRQKMLIGITVIAGLSLMICSGFDLLSKDKLNYMIFLYGISVPMLLLMLDTVIDLNDKTVFNIWLSIAIVMLIISLITFNNDKFIISRREKVDPTTGLASLITNYSTSSLKALLNFLIAYWLVNKLLNKKGLFVLNTFKQPRWHHDIVQRKITWLDVVTNVILYAIIVGTAIFGY